MTLNNEQLNRENDVLKTDNTHLRTDNDNQKDDIGQLTTLVDKMAVNNESQIQQINSQNSEIVQLRTEVDMIKAENIQLRTEVDTTKVENIQLKSENDDLRRQTDMQTHTGATQKLKVSQ